MSASNIILGATGGGNLIRLTTFTSSGTWTKQADVARILVQVVGGGGNGGTGINALVAGLDYPGFGGGAGGFSMKLISSASLSATESVTVGGSGGTSSFGVHCSATGGSAGSNGTNTNTPSGGVGGSGSGGDINLSGGRGSPPSTRVDTNAGSSGSGGSTIFGGGAPGVLYFNATTNISGNAGAANTGGGGGGGWGTTTNTAGGAGGSGIVIVYEYGY